MHRLRVTVSDDVFNKLKECFRPSEVSIFVNNAIRQKLEERKKRFEEEYHPHEKEQEAEDDKNAHEWVK
jgi:predicted CopG family antitoxin